MLAGTKRRRRCNGRSNARRLGRAIGGGGGGGGGGDAES